MSTPQPSPRACTCMGLCRAHALPQWAHVVCCCVCVRCSVGCQGTSSQPSSLPRPPPPPWPPSARHDPNPRLKRRSDSPPTPSTCNLLSASAQESVAAIVRARPEQSQRAVVDVVSPLCDSEPKELMLRCHWERFPTTLQSHTLMRMEGVSKSWKGIGDIQPDQLSSMFPVDDLASYL